MNKEFKTIQYIDKSHTYYSNKTGKDLISVTTLLGKLREPFNATFWSAYTALKRSGFVNMRPSPPYKIIIDNIPVDINDLDQYELSVSQEDVQKQWNIAKRIGTSLGTYLHNTMENKFLRKELEYDIPAFVYNLSSIDAVRYIKARENLKAMADRFYDSIKDEYTPVYLEYVIGDDDLGVAGTFDALLQNNETGNYELWDYKTDKEIRFKSEYGNKIKWFNIPDCEFNKYSLQLNIYKYLIERNTDIKVSECKIIHFDHKNDYITTLRVADYYNDVINFFNNDNSKSIYF